MDWQQIVSFALIVIVIEVSPGPNFALITRSMARGGQAEALSNISGFSTAFVVHGTLSIFGMAALLAASPGLLIVMQIAGALYLLYLGIQSLSIRTSPLPRVESVAEKCEPVVNIDSGRQDAIQSTISGFKAFKAFKGFKGFKGFKDGFLTNCLNAKISLFYYAVFPQMTANSDNGELTSFALIVVHILINAIWFFMVTMVLGLLLESKGRDRFMQILSRGSGIALIGFSMLFAVGATQAI